MIAVYPPAPLDRGPDADQVEDDRRAQMGEDPVCRALVHQCDAWRLSVGRYARYAGWEFEWQMEGEWLYFLNDERPCELGSHAGFVWRGILDLEAVEDIPFVALGAMEL